MDSTASSLIYLVFRLRNSLDDGMNVLGFYWTSDMRKVRLTKLDVDSRKNYSESPRGFRPGGAQFGILGPSHLYYLKKEILLETSKNLKC